MTPKEKKSYRAAQQFCKVAADQLNRARAELDFVEGATRFQDQIAEIQQECKTVLPNV